MTNKSASAVEAGEDDSAGAAEAEEVGLAVSEAAWEEAEAEAAAEEDAGSREAEEDPSGAKMPVLMEVGSALDTDAELAADPMETVTDADTLAEAETVAEAEAEGRAHARFLVTGDANAGAARARTGSTESRVENIILMVRLDT